MKHQLIVRSAVISEREALEALQWRASLDNPNDREALLANPDAISLPLQQIVDGGVFVAEDAGIVKGFAAILPRSDGNSELDALFVEPACWRQGIGRVLLEHCVVAASEVGAAYLHVVGNPHAERFYVTCGFESIGKAQTRFGTGLSMRRVIQ
ncbi:MAG: GNAT family N-acetyltransferase [Tahibacter sp.]